jgi:hypothetical protein
VKFFPRWQPLAPRKTYQARLADAWYEFHTLAEVVRDAGYSSLIFTNEPPADAAPEQIEQATQALRAEWNRI